MEYDFTLLYSSKSLLCYLFAYGVGAIPFGYILVKAKDGRDIRKMGSGNIGATNVMRNTNKFLGALTLVLDSLKGFLAVKLIPTIYENPSHALLAMVGLFVVIGHCFPVWFRFCGGKGVATGLGAIAAQSYSVALVGIFVFLVLVVMIRKVSLSSIVAACSMVIAGVFFFDQLIPKVVFAIMVAIVIYRHKTNMYRLLNKEEPEI